MTEGGFTHEREMPRDVAVEGPHTRVIRIVLRDNMPIWPQHLGVATLRICGVDKGLAIVEAFAFVENVHVVAMEVHWLDLCVSADSSLRKWR